MLFRLTLLTILSISLIAKELPFNLSAKEVFMTKDTVEASGEVTVSGEGYLLKADYGKYYDSNKTLFLEGDVEVYKDSKLYLLTNSIKANIDFKEGFMEPFFMMDKDSGTWIAASSSNLKDSVYTFDECTVSSCEVADPKWYIEATKSSFNQEAMTISARNPIFYFLDIPILYLPYIWFSIDDTRRTGLLVPHIGFSNKEGFVYEQSLYIAPMDSWDLELTPQIRTTRGEGLYSTFRFADTPHSKGSIKFGYFEDKQSFTDKNDLRYGSHYGYELRYESSSVFADKSSFIEDDGLYLDWVYMSDIDYKNLQRDSGISVGEDNFVTSELNYVAAGERDYFAFYNKYFIDTEIYDNSETLQKFPSLNYHRYSSTLFNDYVIYSLDYKYSRFYRQRGLNASMNEFNFPIGLVLPMANDYLTFRYTHNAYFNNVGYSTPNMTVAQNYDDGNFIRTYHQFSVESDLTKEYEDFLHTLNLKANYIRPGVKEKSGYYPDFITLPSDSEEVRFDLSQYFYNNRLFNFLYHKISQPIHISDSENSYGDLINEIRYRYDRNIEFYNRVRYKHEEGRIARSSTGAFINLFPYKFEISHYYDDSNGTATSNFLILGAEKRFDRFSIYGKIGYDNNDNFARWWEGGVYESSRCLDYKVALRRESTPVLKSEGSSSIDETKIFFELVFVPFFGLKQSVKAY